MLLTLFDIKITKGFGRCNIMSNNSGEGAGGYKCKACHKRQDNNFDFCGVHVFVAIATNLLCQFDGDFEIPDDSMEEKFWGV